MLVAKEVAPRTGPSDMHPESFEQPLHEGVEFRVLAREGGWVKAKLPDGAACWLSADAVGTYQSAVDQMPDHCIITSR